jgi:Domain of unknown function (DUF1906)
MPRSRRCASRKVDRSNVTAAVATPGKWADSSTPLGPSVCAAVKAAGVVGVMRYVPLPGNAASRDITAGELNVIGEAGLELLLVQHVRRPPWLPGKCDGYSDGVVARGSAVNAGYPAGAHIFLDLEGAMGDAEGVTGYVGDWAKAVRLGGQYPAGLYVGYNAVLTPAQLYALPGFDCYWSDAGHRKVATRGVAIMQGTPMVLGGVQFDADDMAPDLLGGLPIACIPVDYDASTGKLPIV